MLCGFTADQGTACLYTAFTHSLDNLLNHLRHVLSAGDIVQEKQGFRTAADNVVHTHGHTVDADGVVPVHQKGYFQLRAHAVGAGYQHRLLHTGQIRNKQSAESAHI